MGRCSRVPPAEALNRRRRARPGWGRGIVAFPLLLLVAWTVRIDHAVAAEPPHQELVLIGQPRDEAKLNAVATEGLSFTLAGAERSVAWHELVRWGHPAAAVAKSEAVLTDGSRLALAESWLGEAPIVLAADQATLNVADAGSLTLPRTALARVLWSLPRDPQQRARLERRLLVAARDHPREDAALLASGDVAAGRILSIGKPRSQDDATPVVEFDGALGRLALPLTELLGASFAPAADDRTTSGRPGGQGDAEGPAAVVFTRSGSELQALRVQPAEGGLVVTIADDAQVGPFPIDAVAAVQGRGSRVRYLSDLPCERYESHPALAAEWPLARDGAVAGGPLLVGGRRFAKGLGIHAAARAEFAVPAGATRFVADVALDDTAGGGGSVTCRVLTRRPGEDRWGAPFLSPLLRGGDRPLTAAIDVSNARQIALVVDTAERGDELDRTAWLDARFEFAD